MEEKNNVTPTEKQPEAPSQVASTTPDSNSNPQATNAKTLQQPISTKRSFIIDNPLLIMSGVLYIFSFMAAFGTFLTQEYGIAELASAMTFYTGIPAALLLGAGVVHHILRPDTAGSGSRPNSYTMIGIALMIASVVGSLVTLIPGIVLLVIGSKKPAKMSDMPLSTGAKVALAIFGFIGAGVTGLTLTAFLFIVTSIRTCELSSSKCY